MHNVDTAIESDAMTMAAMLSNGILGAAYEPAQLQHLGLKIVVEVFVIWYRAGILKDAGFKLVGHVDAGQALHTRKVCDLLAAIVARQAQAKHACIIACSHILAADQLLQGWRHASLFEHRHVRGDDKPGD